MIGLDKLSGYAQMDYWMKTAQNELNCFDDFEKSRATVKGLLDVNMLKWYYLEEFKGVIAYCIIDDFRGNDCVSEIFMYIKPEYRGSIRPFKELVEHLEQVAKENKCKSVRIASNIGYNDKVVLKTLQRFGYSVDVVVKEV